MQLKYIVDVNISVTLTRAEFDFIFNGAKTHYSHDCSSLTEVGGCLYGWKGRWDFALKQEKAGEKPVEDWVRQYTFTPRNFQLLIKSIEFDESPMAKELKAKLRVVFQTQEEMRSKLHYFMEANQPAQLQMIK